MLVDMLIITTTIRIIIIMNSDTKETDSSLSELRLLQLLSPTIPKFFPRFGVGRWCRLDPV